MQAQNRVRIENTRSRAQVVEQVPHRCWILNTGELKIRTSVVWFDSRLPVSSESDRVFHCFLRIHVHARDSSFMERPSLRRVEIKTPTRWQPELRHTMLPAGLRCVAARAGFVSPGRLLFQRLHRRPGVRPPGSASRAPAAAALESRRYFGFKFSDEELKGPDKREEAEKPKAKPRPGGGGASGSSSGKTTPTDGKALRGFSLTWADIDAVAKILTFAYPTFDPYGISRVKLLMKCKDLPKLTPSSEGFPATDLLTVKAAEKLLPKHAEEELVKKWRDAYDETLEEMR